jgi:hypothetical protein
MTYFFEENYAVIYEPGCNSKLVVCLINSHEVSINVLIFITLTFHELLSKDECGHKSGNGLPLK